MEHNIVHQLLCRAAQIAVVVYIAQHPFGDVALRLGHLGQVDLRFQFFNQTASADDRHLPFVIVRRSVLGLQHIARRLVVRYVLLVVELIVLQRVALTAFFIAVIGHIALVEFLVVICSFLFLCLIAPFLQCRVFLQLFVDPLHQLNRRQLQHADHLDLRGRQLGRLG